MLQQFFCFANVLQQPPEVRESEIRKSEIKSWATGRRLLASLTSCGQEAYLAQVIMSNGVASSKNGLLTKTGLEALFQGAFHELLLIRSA